MPQMTKEDIEKVETLVFTGDPTWVFDPVKKESVLKKKGDTIDLGGNDKLQLLASKRAEVVPQKDSKK